MKNLRKYANEPFKIAVIHGGPGAPGEMAPVARELSSVRGVLEPNLLHHLSLHPMAKVLCMSCLS